MDTPSSWPTGGGGGGGCSPLEETLLDLSIQKFQICLSYIHAMDQPQHTDEGMCGHARGNAAPNFPSATLVLHIIISIL